MIRDIKFKETTHVRVPKEIHDILKKQKRIQSISITEIINNLVLEKYT